MNASRRKGARAGTAGRTAGATGSPIASFLCCVLVAAGFWASPAAAQSGPSGSGPGALAQPCRVGSGPELAARCADAALGAHAVLGGLGMLAGAGGAFPVSPSTIGHRLEGSPRFLFDGGLAFSSFQMPDLTRMDGGGGARHGRRSLVGARLAVAAGVFDGFSPAPTLGGVGSVDAVGTLRVLRLPSGDGFSGSTLGGGGGVRIGLVRESFSIPGVTLTLLHQRIGGVDYGDLDADGAVATVRPRVSTARLEVGKDMLALGVTGGVGLDRISGEAEIAARVGDEAGSGGPLTLRQTRRTLFLGANYTWIVAQVAGELAWSSVRKPAGGLQGTGGFEPGGSGLQGALTFRVLY